MCDGGAAKRELLLLRASEIGNFDVCKQLAGQTTTRSSIGQRLDYDNLQVIIIGLSIVSLCACLRGQASGRVQQKLRQALRKKQWTFEQNNGRAVAVAVVNRLRLATRSLRNFIHVPVCFIYLARDNC